MSLLTVLINISSSTYAFTNEEGETKEMYVPKAAYVMDNLVLFDKATYDELYKEVPTYKLIVSERLKVRGSLARRAL